jgi:tripartite-type tricarboxylate transporter receptor subunit TctC
MSFRMNLLWPALVSAVGLHGHALAQKYPAKPIRMMVASAPGGITDIMARGSMAESIGRLGQPMVAENRAGAGGAIAVEHVAKSAPDGYTLVIANVGNISIYPWVSKSLLYDPLKELAAVSTVAEVPSPVVIHAKLPVNTMKEFIAYAKERPGRVSYASSGVATMPHLGAELLSVLADIKMVHVPYKGGALAAIDLGAGRVDMGLFSMGSVRAQYAAGQVRMLAIAAPTRLASLPDVPTLAEAGVDGYAATNWFGVLAPAGTPRDILQALNNRIAQSYDNPEALKQLNAAGAIPMKESVDAFQKRIVADHAKWRDVIHKAGIQPE